MATKKDAYYFSHDANAQDDPKCMLLIDQMGLEGYGIFWALIEKLRAEKDFKLPFAVIPSLARRWGTSKEKVETVVNVYGLFEIEDIGFFSARLVRSMREKSETARINAQKRWPKTIENMPIDATALPPQCDGIIPHMPNDAIKGKESKEKEIESKENWITTPTSDIELTLPEKYIKSAIEQIKMTKNVLLTEDKVKGMFEPFKIQNLNGVKFYQFKSDVYSHFINWLKKQDFKIDVIATQHNSLENHKNEYQKAIDRQNEKLKND